MKKKDIPEQPSISRLKKKVEKITALSDYYENLKKRKIGSEEELKDVKAKIVFSQKQMIKMCLESKKILKEIKKE